MALAISAWLNLFSQSIFLMTYRSDIFKCEFTGRINPPHSEVSILLSEVYAAFFILSSLHLRFEFAALVYLSRLLYYPEKNLTP
jgi:hypothetical protein